MSRTSTDQVAKDGTILNGYDYALQCWVVNGLVSKCGHPEKMRGCNGCNYEGRRVADLVGHDVRPVQKAQGATLNSDETAVGLCDCGALEGVHRRDNTTGRGCYQTRIIGLIRETVCFAECEANTREEIANDYADGDKDKTSVMNEVREIRANAGELDHRAEEIARRYDEFSALFAAAKEVFSHRNLMLSRAGAAGYRQTTDGTWVSDPASAAFKKLGEVIAGISH